MIYYDIQTNEWHSQKILNNEIKPRAAHSCTKINDDKVILFAGRTQLCRTNDLYVINLKDFSCSKK